MGFIQDKLIALLLPLILAPLVVKLTQLTKKYWEWLDQQHPAFKQVIAAGWAAILTSATAAAGQSLCQGGVPTCELIAVDWRVVLTWGFSLALHGWKKKS